MTIIPPELYKETLCEVVPAECHLRAWGAKGYLDTKGMVNTTIVTTKGARITTNVYI